jgi:type II secretory pathway pseudopilin PulG
MHRAGLSGGRGERGDIVLGWLTRLVVVLAVLGTIAFDGVSLAQARFQAADRATTAANAAADAYKASRDVQTAFNAAYATLSPGDTIETQTFTVAADGTVTLRLHHQAPTLLVSKIGPLKHWQDAVETGEAKPAA